VKLALVSAKYPFGGKEPYLHAELRHLAPYFERVAVFPTSPPDAPQGFEGVAGDVFRLGLFSPSTFARAAAAVAMNPAGAARAVAALLRAPYPAKVKLKNLAVLPLGLAIGRQLRRDGIDHVHSYWLSTPATVAFVAAHVARIPWSSTGHLWDIYENNALAAKLPSARFVRAISQRGRRDLYAALPARAAASIEVVHVGVDVPPAPPDRVVDAAPAAGAAPFALLCAANLVRKKGHADLLEALAELRDRDVRVHCTIAGDGELRDALRAQAASLGIDAQVTFRGHVAHATLLDEIRAGRYDAMVLTSLELPGGLMEGIPVALMEAMALGLPVVTTDTGSIGELVDDTCGRVVEQRDVTAIAAAIAELAQDPDLRATLARAAHAKVAADFNVTSVAKRLAQLIGSDRAR
jgi:glycosyltransferase involved in cell wall biosynthesis